MVPAQPRLPLNMSACGVQTQMKAAKQLQLSLLSRQPAPGYTAPSCLSLHMSPTLVLTAAICRLRQHKQGITAFWARLQG